MTGKICLVQLNAISRLAEAAALATLHQECAICHALQGLLR